MESDLKTACNGEKVLIITGDGAFGERVKQRLSEIGYDARLVKDGKEGLKAVYDILPHLVLLDIELAGMNGYEVLSSKQQEPLLANIPVFLMSTQGVPINMRQVPPGSVKEFIVSIHANPEDVTNRVNEHFKCAPEAPKPADDVLMKKILWVEDDKLIGNILGKKMLASGFDLIRTKNGEEALAELGHTVPDAILIDLLLPGMSGFEILQKIREDQKFKSVPIMILSNLSKPSDIEKAKALGAQRFLVKATASLDQIVVEVRNLSSQKVA